MNTLKSEWTKLTSTKAFWWTTALFIIFALGMAALSGRMVVDSQMGFPLLMAHSTLLGIVGFGLYVVVIQAVMVVTSEYRHNVQSATFMATPKRPVVAAAKLLLYGVIIAALSAVLTLACYYVAKLFAEDHIAATLDVFDNPVALKFLWVIPATCFMLTMFSQGFAWLLRQTAGAISLLLIWLTALEQLLGMLPKVGDHILHYGPITNLMAFANNQDIFEGPWSAGYSGLYFLAWAVAIWGIGVLVMNRRDA